MEVSFTSDQALRAFNPRSEEGATECEACPSGRQLGWGVVKTLLPEVVNFDLHSRFVSSIRSSSREVFLTWELVEGGINGVTILGLKRSGTP